MADTEHCAISTAAGAAMPLLRRHASGKNGPLAGIRILDLTSVMLGPYATQLMGDYGADIIKVESPEGDSTRRTGPAVEAGMAATFVGANRSKRSIVLDLKQQAARDVLLKLAREVDVLIYSMRPQKMEALGLAPHVLRSSNPRLIVVGIHGFSESGPYAGRPAYDDIIQGLSGMASLSELRGDEPAYLPTVVADKTSGLFAVQAVLMALVGRAQSDEGCFVEVPMFESMVNFTLVEHMYGAHFQPPLSPPGYPRMLTKWRRPYRTSDGYVCLVPYSDQHWRRLFTEANESALLDDERFAGLAARTQNIDALYAELARCVALRTTAEWIEACDRLDIPAAPLCRLHDLQNDPHLAQTGYFLTLEDPEMGPLVMPSAPLRFNGARVTPTLPPRLGEHTVEVLKQAGFNAADIQGLLDSRAVIQKPATDSGLQSVEKE